LPPSTRFGHTVAIHHNRFALTVALGLWGEPRMPPALLKQRLKLGPQVSAYSYDGCEFPCAVATSKNRGHPCPWFSSDDRNIFTAVTRGMATGELVGSSPVLSLTNVRVGTRDMGHPL
jgi:hypothetical protein